MIIEVSKERTLELLDKIAEFIASRRMGAPALLFLESVRPLHFLGSQVMFFLAPFANVLFSGQEFEEFATILEKEENVRYLIHKIDLLDEEMNRVIREQERMKRRKLFNRIKTLFSKKNKEKK